MLWVIQKIAFALKGGAEGVGLSNILFVLNLLEANFDKENLKDDLLEVAFQETLGDLNNIIEILTFNDNDIKFNAVDSFLNGANISIISLPVSIGSLTSLVGSIPIAPVSGFEDGFRKGLNYIREQLSGIQFPF